jgi:hypothetical protein
MENGECVLFGTCADGCPESVIAYAFFDNCPRFLNQNSNPG